MSGIERVRNNARVDIDVSVAEVALALAIGLAGASYIAFILMPAWESYGRLWERLGAAFLSLYILATVLGVGAAIGVAIVWSYDRYA